MSNYVQKLKQDSINQFDKEMELRRFREKFKPQIENGLTLAEFKRKYDLSDNDIENFNIVEQEVQRETELGEAFLAGFQSSHSFWR